MKKIIGKSSINPLEDFFKIRKYLEQDAIRKGDRYSD